MVETVLVCGHGRCGSSLVMQMLEAGGFPVYGEYPAFEPEDVGFGRDMESLLHIGKAVKILDPQISAWPKRFIARVIWLSRDPKQQAKSQLKFLKTCNPELRGVPDNAWRELARSYKSDTRDAQRIFDLAGVPMLILRFEVLLRSPLSAAVELSKFVGGIDVERAAKVVLPRNTNCAPDCSIELAAISRGSANVKSNEA